MEKMKIPKFEMENDEANWADEHREVLAEAFMSQHRQHKEEGNSRLEVVLNKALRTNELAITPDELKAGNLVSVLREKLAHL
jgi:hypothetical protein